MVVANWPIRARDLLLLCYNTCFLNHHYFWNLFAFLLENYVAVGLFYDEWNNSSIQLFSNRHYFWNPLFACLLAKYVAGGLFDERNEGSFFTWGVRFTHVTVENALLCFTAPNTNRDSVTPKMTFEFAFAAQQNDLRTFNQAFLPRKARKESGNSSPVSPGHRSKMAARRWVDRPWSFF